MTTTPITARFTSTPVESAVERATAYAMRYQAYRACGAITPREDESFFDRYDGRPHCTTYLLFERDGPIASIRACVYSEAFDQEPIPGLEVYRDAIEAHIGLDRTIVESNRFIFAPDYQRSVLVPKLHLFRNIARAALDHQADFIITAVRKKHEEFYQKLCFTAISDERTYPCLKVKMILMACDCAAALPRMRENRLFSAILLD
jgi:hypothetical protein